MKRPPKAAKTARKTRPQFFVYVLGCLTRNRHLTYVGWTNDLELRLARHNDGTGARSTRGHIWILLHSERHRSKEAAMSREWHLKRDRKFRKQLANAWASTGRGSGPI